jgi:hypothetical protein
MTLSLDFMVIFAAGGRHTVPPTGSWLGPQTLLV